MARHRGSRHTTSLAELEQQLSKISVDLAQEKPFGGLGRVR